MYDIQSHSKKLISTDSKILREIILTTANFYCVFICYHFSLLICTVEFAEFKRIRLLVYISVSDLLELVSSAVMEFQARLCPLHLFVINGSHKNTCMDFNCCS